jgi:hypothetical protein
MHYTFLFLALFGVLYTPSTPETVSVPVTVTHAATGKPVAGATVLFTQQSAPAGRWQTDSTGRATAVLLPGIYTLEIMADTFVSLRLYETPVEAKTTVNARLFPAYGAPQTTVMLYSTAHANGTLGREPRLEEPHTEEPGMYDTVVTFDPETYEERVVIVRNDKALAPATATLTGSAAAGIKTKEAYNAKTKKASDKTAPAPVEKSDELLTDDVAAEPMRETVRGDMPAPGKPIPSEPAPAAGILTAGEWNELHNWNTHWLDQLADGETDVHQNTYSFFPRHRYPVLITNRDAVPLPDVPVQLIGAGGKVLWEARTDNNGQAELWDALFEKNNRSAGTLRVFARVNGRMTDLGSADSTLNIFRINQTCQTLSRVDIVWVVDATGSMGDEIRFLKSELLDVISRVKTGNPALDLRMGSVFYRDRTDDYITRSSALDPDIRKTVDFIQNQSAGGGGDTPEAVHSALEEAIERQPWSTEALARICFLVLDASPHQNPEVIASLQRSIRLAAQKGIRIVPVSASGIAKDTEYLMKFFGMATNGTYVFLTNHSGVGGDHLEPDADTYTVEPFNRLLVRLISEYTRQQQCDGQTAIRFEPGEQTPEQQALYYPNPAVDVMTLELPFDADKVSVYNAEGASVLSLGKLASGKHTLRLQDLTPGMYTLRIWKGGQVQTGKVMVVRV